MLGRNMLGSQAMRQIIVIGLVCFGTVGMFNAISSVGNAGKHNNTNQNLAITSSSIAYIIGFLISGGLHNMLGPRPCVAFGGLTFVVYVAAMYYAGDDEDSLYPPLAGILLGFGGGLIWVTQGAMMMSYPTEDNKGKYIGAFWAIFNLGAVFGSVLPLIINSKPGMDLDDFDPLTYKLYMIIMAIATCLSIFLVRPSTIVRDNGEPVIVTKFQGVRAETIAILSVFCDWRMLLLIPAFFFSNFSYTYQFNDFNGSSFNIRTRSLNSVLFWISQIIGALVIGYVLDRAPYRRPKRAMLGLALILLLFMGTWIGAYVSQIKNNFERNQIAHKLLDYEKHGVKYTGLLAVYAMFGFCDAAFACFCYWLMGALSNKYDDLSRYAGFFKAIQSLGSAVAAPLDLAQTPLEVYLVTNWILCAISMIAMFLVCKTITDTTIDDNDSASYYGDSIADDDSYDDGPRSIAGATEYEGESAPSSRAPSFSDPDDNDSQIQVYVGNGDRPSAGRRRPTIREMEHYRGAAGGGTGATAAGGGGGMYDEEAALGVRSDSQRRGMKRSVRTRRSQELAPEGSASSSSSPSTTAIPAMAEVRSTPQIAFPKAAILAPSMPPSSHHYSQFYSESPKYHHPSYLTSAQSSVSASAASSSSSAPSSAAGTTTPYPYLYIPSNNLGNNNNNNNNGDRSSSNNYHNWPPLDLNGGLLGVGPNAVVGLGGRGGFTGLDGTGAADMDPSTLMGGAGVGGSAGAAGTIGGGGGGGVGGLFLQVPSLNPGTHQAPGSQRSSTGLLSATTTFTSSEEEEMDDFDTRSILTVSSAGHDSIPDMGEMSPFPASLHSPRTPYPAVRAQAMPPLQTAATGAPIGGVGGIGQVEGGSTTGQGSSSSTMSSHHQFPPHFFPATFANNHNTTTTTTTTIHSRPHSPTVSIASPNSSPISSPGSSPPSSPRLSPLA
ncbi:hypothetical protein DFQ27_001248 [Actinomortierella ambigua]|uniref:MFS general substrate transporter n=1 Tax=Actinomortierella ambigua TaxID=1343610 RepID=A0A9P6QML4_9FUNG|nr:hypothetical protein DFQ27_001248 [Actinomortierella ambigua]